MSGVQLLTPSAINAPLRRCGYGSELLLTGLPAEGGSTFPLVAFSHLPADSRSACVAVLGETQTPRLAVEACRPLATPIVFVCAGDTLQWWKLGAATVD